MEPITLLTTAKSSSPEKLDDQKKVTEIETTPNRTTAPNLSKLLEQGNSLNANQVSGQQKQQIIDDNSINSVQKSSLTARPDLVGRLGNINLPNTIEFGAQGKAKVIVTNQGQATASGPCTVKLYISTDGEIDSNDALLTSVSTNLNLQAGKSVTLNLQYQNNTSVIAPGAYFLIAQVDANNQIVEQLETNNVASKLVSGRNTNVIIDWNAIALNAIQAEGKAGRGVPPTLGSRLMALLSTAVYDTVNAFNNCYPSYAVDVNAPSQISLEAAVVGAAYQILSTKLPGQNSLLSQQVANSMAEIGGSNSAKNGGFNFGVSIANQSINLRANDGSNNNTPYTPPAGDYVWRPETSGPTAGVALGANWGGVDTWAIDNVAQFAPDGLDGRPDNPADNGALYAQEIEEVRLYGGETSTLRTADQTQSAIFWAYDRANTFRPYGQLNQIAQEVAVREGTSLQENASLFAALNTAMADAVIIAWDAKYKELQPRPDDVIAGGFAANDGIAATVGDPNWKPLLSDLIGVNSPPFPDYMSGHSAMGGAFAGVMTKYFGNNYQFSAVSQELPGVVRNFSSFYQAGMEDALSRIYGGVHVREACIDSFEMGLDVGNYVATNFFQPTA